MRLVIQRVKHALVTVDGQKISSIGNGLLVLLGISNEDTKETADKMLAKLLKLRIFADENGKSNLSVIDISGELMIISQFTLYADCRKGNRPSFTDAGNPTLANELYEYMLVKAEESIGRVAAGSFGADMKVALLNDGPYTIVLDSRDF